MLTHLIDGYFYYSNILIALSHCKPKVWTCFFMFVLISLMIQLLTARHLNYISCLFLGAVCKHETPLSLDHCRCCSRT